MESQESRLTLGRIALAVLGALLLLPGLCGAAFIGAASLEHVSRGTLRFSDYEEIVWVIAQPSLMAGCLGLFVLAKTMKKPALVKAARAAGWFALAATVVVCVFILYASRTGEGVPMALWFAFCFAVGGLPCLLMGRREKRENGA